MQCEVIVERRHKLQNAVVHHCSFLDDPVDQDSSELDPVNTTENGSIQGLISDITTIQVVSIRVIFKVNIGTNLSIKAKPIPQMFQLAKEFGLFVCILECSPRHILKEHSLQLRPLEIHVFELLPSLKHQLQIVFVGDPLILTNSLEESILEHL